MTVVNEKKIDSFLLRLRQKDTPTGVSIDTFNALTDVTGLSKTELTHLALREFANRNIRRYEDDDGHLTEQQFKNIKSISKATQIHDDEFKDNLFK